MNCQKRLVEYLGIEKLLAVAGGSMGGMQVLAWLAMYPEMLCSAIPIATNDLNTLHSKSPLTRLADRPSWAIQTGNQVSIMEENPRQEDCLWLE